MGPAVPGPNPEYPMGRSQPKIQHRKGCMDSKVQNSRESLDGDLPCRHQLRLWWCHCTTIQGLQGTKPCDPAGESLGLSRDPNGTTMGSAGRLGWNKSFQSKFPMVREENSRCLLWISFGSYLHSLQNSRGCSDHAWGERAAPAQWGPSHCLIKLIC